MRLYKAIMRSKQINSFVRPHHKSRIGLAKMAFYKSFALVAISFLLFGQIPNAAAYDPAVNCVPGSCALPNCLCSSTNIPGNLDPATIPQIVMLSFDDALETALYYPYYEPLFNRTNPNGCKIGITYFLSHDYTDYTLVNDVYKRGHEIASHSITHQTPTTYWATLDYQGWIDQMYGLKQIASNLANIPMDAIQGTRAPFLQLNGDVTFSALDDTGFHYDCTLPTLAYEYNPLWPYTLDYKSVQDCPIPPCPKDAYPGFWEMPLNDFNSSSGNPCAMLDTCTSTNTTNSTFNFLLTNFNVHYYGDKAPFGLFTHASWFETDASHYPGYTQFIDYLGTLDDVFIVTVANAIEWAKAPTAMTDIANFAPWSCASLPTAPCTVYKCFYNQTTPGGQRYMNSCVPCPPNYPWLGDPYGNNTATKK